MVGPKSPIAIKIGSDDAKDSIAFSRRQIAFHDFREPSDIATADTASIPNLGNLSCSQDGNMLHNPYADHRQVDIEEVLGNPSPAKTPLKTWYAIAGKAARSGPADVKKMFGANVDFVSDNRIIFDFSGDKYRLIVHIAHPCQRVLVKFVGTHTNYHIIPETV
ncbi:mRNA-degrading endonuclease HigB of HigAB toxin-antitoxin module [Rhizobium sp. SG741]|nr:mRNA-degrading endonuclease HigB of HigAB toxin-antitoxin module [Rhizobium sp. SG741]